jgi:hypothetical protein
VVGRVGLQVADGVGSPDRVRLSEQVVGEPDVAIGVGAGELGERGSGARAHLRFVHPEQGREVPVALAALEQQLKHCALFWGDRH